MQKIIVIAFLISFLEHTTLSQITHIRSNHHFCGTTLINAIQERSIAATRNVLRKMSNMYKSDPENFAHCVNTHLSDGSTALMFAASLDSTERLSLLLNTLTALLKSNPDMARRVLNAQDNHGKSALYYAAERKNVKATRMLLNTAKILFKNNPAYFFNFLMLHTEHTHWTPLMNAIFQSSSSTAEALIHEAQSFLGEESKEFKDFINAEDIYGRTALELAIEPWDRLLLLRHGAQKKTKIITDRLHEIQKKMGQKLLHYASHLGHESDLKNIFQEAKRIFHDDEKYYFLFMTTRDQAGWTALMNASADGHDRYIELLMQAIKDYFQDDQMAIMVLNLTDIHGRSALQLAIQRHHFKTIKALIENEKKAFGNNKTLFMRFINEHGEINGFTPLIAAAEISTDDEISLNVIKLLVERAKEVLTPPSLYFDEFINARDFDGKTALAYANNKYISAYLKANGAHL